MKIKRKKGFFSISAVAEMFSIHQQTVRLYEKQGLITPKRSSGNTRLFSEEDIERLEEVIHLTHELGINLAGVEMILKLKKQIQKMQNDMNKMFKQAQDQLEKDSELSKESIQASVTRLMRMKKAKVGEKQPSLADLKTGAPVFSFESNEVLSQDVSSKSGSDPDLEADVWEIEYDE